MPLPVWVSRAARGEFGARAVAYPQANGTFHSFDEANQPERSVQRDVIVDAGSRFPAQGHEIGEGNAPGVGGEGGLQDIGTSQIASLGLMGVDGRRLHKSPLAGVQNPTKNRIGVEPTQGAPVHATFARHQRGAVAITNQRVVTKRGIGLNDPPPFQDRHRVMFFASVSGWK